MSDNTLPRALPLTVRANFAWNLSGKVVYAASRALILILIAKLGTAEMVGRYALAFAVTTPVFMLADLDLRSVLATDTENRLEFGHYLGLRLVTTAMAMAAVCVMAALQGDPQTRAVTVLVGAAKAFETVSDMYYGIQQKNERLNRPGISMMARGALSVLVMGLLLWLRRSLAEAVAGLALAWLLTLLLYDIPAGRAYAPAMPRFHPRSILGLARLSLPLGIVFLFASLGRNMSNYFIQADMGTESLGYFSAMAYLMATGSLVAGALGQSTNMRLARYYGQGDTKAFTATIRRTAACTVGAGVLAAAVSLAFGGRILALLYTPEYAAYGRVFAVVMCGACISYVAELTNYAVTATRRFRIQPVIHGSALLAAVALNWLLVPNFGLMGAAWCVAAVSCVQLAGNIGALAHAVAGKRKKTQAAGMPEASGYRVVRARSLRDLAPDQVAGWKDMLTRSTSRLPYSDPDWLSAWWDAFGGKREPVILLLYAGDDLAGVLPLMADKRAGCLFLSWIGSPQADCFEPAVLPGCADGVIRAALGYIGRLGGNVVARLEGLPAESPACGALERQLADGRYPRVFHDVPAYVIRAGGMDFDSLHRSRFSSNGRKLERKRDIRLKALGAVAVRELAAGDMAAAFELHNLRWRKKLDTSRFGSAESRRFFTGLVGCGNGRWRTLPYGLFVGGRLVAFFYSFVCAGRFTGYTMAHDDLFSVYSPGKILLREYIRSCMDSGAEEISLGPGFEEYKAAWTDETETVRGVAFSKRNAASRLLFSGLAILITAKRIFKRSRMLVLFKRNTLGRLRYILSPGRIFTACARLRLAARKAGFREFTARALGIRGRERHYRFVPARAAAAAPRAGGAFWAGPEDAEELALLQCCGVREIMGRFFRLEKCCAVRSARGISFAAWVEPRSGEATISACRADRQTCTSRDVVCVLQEILACLHRQKCGFVTLTLDGGFRLIGGAAERAGFVRADPPAGGENGAKATAKGGRRHAGPCH